ncbi:MAK10-like protein [Tanacetum coccineum]
MGDENPIFTLGDYNRPSLKGYRDTIELPDGNNVVTLRSDAIRLVQNGCSVYRLREMTRLSLFQFSLRDQASNWLEPLLAGSISTWEDLTTRFLAQLFPPGRTYKLCNDILMFQQHQGESLSEAWTRFKDLLQKFSLHGIDLWLQIQIFYDHVNPTTRRTIDQSAGGKLRDKHAEESWALIEDLALYDKESWNDPRYFAKPVKAISLPQVVPSTSDRCLIELENQVQRLMEAHLAPKSFVQVNKITSSYKYAKSLELGENRFAFVQGEMPKKLKDPELFTLPCRLGDFKPFNILVDLGSCMNIILLYLFKKHKIGLLEELGNGTKSYPVGIVKNVEVHIGKLKLLEDFYVLDMENDLTTPLLIGRGFLTTAGAIIDCNKAKIAVGEGVTRSIFRVKVIDLGDEVIPYWTTLGKRESY